MASASDSIVPKPEKETNTLAEEAVLVKSERMPTGSLTVKG